MRLPPSKLITSRHGIELIYGSEDFRATAYKDPAGIWTIGLGKTKGVTPGQKTTFKRAFADSIDHIATVEDSVRSYVHVNLYQHEFDALISFIYNVGAGAFMRSTLRKKVNDLSYFASADEFKRWINSGGRRLKGLVKRRIQEEVLWRTGRLLRDGDKELIQLTESRWKVLS